MMEPLILAYGRGELPEMPGAADTTVDVVPVDHVVAAIVAVLAHPPEVGTPAYFHVSSGDRNPLTFRDALRERARLLRRPPVHLRRPRRDPAARVALPGLAVRRAAAQHQRARLQGRRLRHRPRAAQRPHARPGPQARPAGPAAGVPAPLPGALPGVRPGGAAVLRHQHPRALPLAVRGRTRRRSPSTRRSSTGRSTSRTSTARPSPRRSVASTRSGPRASGRRRRPRRRWSRSRDVAAFFDMDGTLLSSNVIETYLWLRLQELSGTERFAELSRIAAKVPSLVQAERRERSAFLRSVYREYDGARLADLDAIADEHLTDHVLTRLSPAAVRKIREHRAAGHRTVLITGAIRPLTRPLLPLFDHIEAAELAVDDRGVCTGYLASSPLVGESRAAWMRQYAADNGIDLAASYGYADSHSDLPLLEAVGRPVAVRPDVPLFRHARKARWTIVDWQSSSSNTRTLNPAGGCPMMLALEMFRSRAADRGRPGGRRADARHPVRVRRAAAADDDRRAEGRPTGLGAAQDPAVRDLRLRPGHAVRQDQPLLLGGGLAAVRARPRGRRRAARRLRGPAGRHPGRRRPGADLRGARRRGRARRARPARPTGASGSPSATWRPGCRPASARTPAAAGASSSRPTAASCTRCPKASPTSRRS